MIHYTRGLTPEERAERRYISIASALHATKASLPNGKIAAECSDLLSGVQTMCFHLRIEGNSARYAEVAFALNHTGSVTDFRIGASLASVLISDVNIARTLDQYGDDEAPWDTYPELWAKFLTFILSTAAMFQNHNPAASDADFASMFRENIDLNTRCETDQYFTRNLGI